MFVMVGDGYRGEDLLKGIIMPRSDAVLLAEELQAEEEFALWWLQKQMKLVWKYFANSSGINDPDNYSTVRDIW